MDKNIINFISIVITCYLIYRLFLKEKIEEWKKKQRIKSDHVDEKHEDKKEEYEDKRVVITSINDLENKTINKVETELYEKVINENRKYVKPPKVLLSSYSQKKSDDEEIINNANRINDTFKEFKVNAKVCDVDISSQVCVYEVELIGNTKVQKVMDLENDLKLSLGTKDVKMINPVPGKPHIGIIVKNKTFSPLGLSQILKDVPGNNKIFFLGKDFYNRIKYINIDSFENMLIAGRHDSGKTMFLHNIIITCLFNNAPEELKMVIIDPKRIEFNYYNGIPHLLTPIVTDPKKASFVLQKIVIMMDERFETFKNSRTKNIEAYNEYVEKELKKNPNCGLKKMPVILVIIDELTDLMVVASKEVEESIMRITKFAHGSGIHLIVATQRPSTDVVTNNIKINIKNHVSFDVASGIDSRTILDTVGAENLFGNGDMLCRISGEDGLLRLQSPYISDEEIKRVVDYIKEKNPYTNFMNDFEDKSTTSSQSNNEEEKDPMFDEVLNYAIRMGQISASLIQRKFTLGYNRAARLMDAFEERGIVGPAKGSKPRDVLVKYDDKDDK